MSQQAQQRYSRPVYLAGAVLYVSLLGPVLFGS